jgi:hypothetical protein
MEFGGTGFLRRIAHRQFSPDRSMRAKRRPKARPLSGMTFLAFLKERPAKLSSKSSDRISIALGKRS